MYCKLGIIKDSTHLEKTSSSLTVTGTALSLFLFYFFGLQLGSGRRNESRLGHRQEQTISILKGIFGDFYFTFYVRYSTPDSTLSEDAGLESNPGLLGLRH
jgi:hypothetical protein